MFEKYHVKCLKALTEIPFFHGEWVNLAISQQRLQIFIKYSRCFRRTIVDISTPANTSTLIQRWNNVDRQRSSTLFRRWYLVENESWADVHLSMLFQHWQNNVETTSIELRRFNVDKTTLFQRWNLVENESWADVCLSTLFQRR